VIGKLAMLRIECPKVRPSGRRSLARLIAKDGLDAKLFESSDEITADCASKQARNVNDLCGTRLSGSAESCLMGPPIII
jgi:hypothetical protein